MFSVIDGITQWSIDYIKSINDSSCNDIYYKYNSNNTISILQISDKCYNHYFGECLLLKCKIHIPQITRPDMWVQTICRCLNDTGHTNNIPSYDTNHIVFNDINVFIGGGLYLLLCTNCINNAQDFMMIKSHNNTLIVSNPSGISYIVCN